MSPGANQHGFFVDFFFKDGSFRPGVPAVMSLFIIPPLVSVLGNWLVFLLPEGCGRSAVACWRSWGCGGVC